jgi:hypothetical protein
MRRRFRASKCAARFHSGAGFSVSIGAMLILFACVAPGVVSAQSDAAAAAVGDTMRAARPDTITVPERKPAWTMDALKTVLDTETIGYKGGAVYRQRKSGRVAMMCALLCPGLGQMYNEKPVKAAIAAGVEYFYLSQILLNRRYHAREVDIRDSYPLKPNPSSEWLFHDSWVKEYWERSVDWTWWSGAAIVAIIVDAYVDAHLDDMHFKMEASGGEDGVQLGLVFPY